jgi:hypothetical protein
MKPILRLLTLVLVLLITPGFVLLAQANCLSGFKAADCQLMSAAAENMSSLTSFNLGYDISLKVGGTAVSISIKGNGPIDFSQITDSDAQSVLTHVSMISYVTVNTLMGSTKQTETIEIRLVDGELYINQEDSGSGWLQVSLNRLFEKSASTFDLAIIGPALRPGSPELFGTLSSTPGMVRGQRLNGPKVDGKATAQFVANLDFGAYYKTLKTDSARKAFLESFLTSFLTGAGRRPTSAQLKDPKLLAAAERTAKTFKMAFLWLVGPADKMLHGIGFNISANVDKVLAGTLNSALGNAALSVDWKFLFTFSKIGDPVKVDPVTEPTTDITDTVANALGIR